MICADCGDELDDFSPCACALAGEPHAPFREPENRYPGGMRRMVARKLARQKSHDKNQSNTE